jgi:predicted metal-binding protein
VLHGHQGLLGGACSVCIFDIHLSVFCGRKLGRQAGLVEKESVAQRIAMAKVSCCQGVKRFSRIITVVEGHCGFRAIKLSSCVAGANRSPDLS